MNKLISWIKTHKFLTVCLVIALTYAWYVPPFKQIDPTKPYFSETWFRLRDYGSAEGAQMLRDKILPKFFPVGTPKEYVDLMLVDRGGARVGDYTSSYEGAYFYFFKPLYLLLTPDGFIIRIYYDKNNKVEAVNFGRKMVVGEGYQPKKVPHKRPGENK